MIFTSAVWRRRGIAAELVNAIAHDAGIAVSEVAWSTPFSTAGQALAMRIAPAGVWLT